MRFTATVAQQQNPTPEQRAELREQVRKSLEDAREQMKAAQQELREAQSQGVRLERIQTPPIPPVPPVPAIEGQPVTVRTERGEYIQIDPNGVVRVNDIPPRAQELGMMFFATMALMVIGFPIARAIGRWMDRRGAVPAVTASSNVEPQLQRIEQAVEAMAIEIERISESQRYLTRLQAGREEEALVPRRSVE